MPSHASDNLRRTSPRADKPCLALLGFMTAHGAASIVLMGMIGWAFERMRGRR
jgi:hypothetical protein